MDKQAIWQMVEHAIDNGVEALIPHGAGPVNEHRLRRELNTVAQIAFREGEHYALSSLMTADDVAAHFGVSLRRARAIIKNRHDRFAIGWQVPNTNQWLVRPEELQHLAPDEKYRRK